MSKNNREIIKKIVQNALSSGFISIKNHDLLIETAHLDGKIDEFESIELKKIFTAIQNGKIRVLEEEDLEIIQPHDLEKKEVSHTIGGNLIDEITVKDQNIFSSVQERIIKATISNKLWIKTGSMIAYEGAISFRREGISEHGLGKLIKRSITGETISLTLAEGNGSLYLSDSGRSLQIIDISKEPIFVQASNLLAFEDSVKWDIKPLFNLSSAMSGGLFHIILNGPGLAVISTEFQPLVLQVKDGKSVFTDPSSTVAWSAGVSPSIRADISIQTLIGRTSGETLQLRFNGDGYVIIQTKKNIIELN